MIPRSLRRLARAAAVCYAAILAASFLLGGLLLAHPWRRPLSLREFLAAVPSDWDRGFLTGVRDVELEIEPRFRLRATLLDGGTSRSVVLLHERGKDRAGHLDLARDLVDDGWNVALLDRRAHGASDGEAAALYADDPSDLKRALDLLIETHGLPTGRLYLVGFEDAGTGALLAGAADPRIDGVCAIGASADPQDFARRFLAGVLPLPRPLLGPPAWMALRGMALFSGRALGELAAGRALAGCTLPALLVARDAEEERAARRLASLFLPGSARVVKAPSPQGIHARILGFLDGHAD